MNRRLIFVLLFFCDLVGVSPLVFAQVDPNVEQGLKPYGTYRGGDIDSISMTNGNLALHIPLFSFSQRGKERLDYALIYNNKSYYFKTTCTKIGGCTNYWWWRGQGVTAKPEFLLGSGSVTVQSNPNDFFQIFSVGTPDGSTHVAGQTLSGPYETVDGTGLLDNVNLATGQGVVTDQQGIEYPPSSGTTCPSPVSEDSDGNFLCYASSGGIWDDTVGRNVLTTASTTDFTGCTGPLPIQSAAQWLVPSPINGSSTFKLCFVSVSIVIAYNLNDGTQTNGTAKMLQSVVLPNGTAWTFSYSTDGNGDLVQVTFPTGGTLSYTWESRTNCNQSLGMPSRWVTSRSLNANDGTGTHTWSYSWSGYNPTSTGVVTDPLGNDTVYTATALGGCSFYVTAENNYQGSQTSGTLLKTVITNYSYAASPFAGYLGNIGGVMNVVPTQITTTWANGKTSQIQRTYDAGFTFKDPDPYSGNTYTGIYGKLLTQQDFDYGNGGPGPLLRKTITSYLALSDSNYLTNNLLALPSSVSVYDGNSNLKAQTTYGYDEYSLQPSGVTTQHDSNPPAGSYRGNLTSIHKWLKGSTVSTTNCPISVSNGYLDSTNTYFDTGMIYQSTDQCGHTTTYTYSSAFAGAYVTQTNLPDTNSPNPAHHVISGNYDFNTGLITSFTDQNSQTSYFSYDSMWRFTTANFPDGGQTSFYYPDVWTVERQQKIDSSRNTDFYIHFDGLGREIRRITANDETTPWDQVDTCYDARGKISFVSYPYQGTGLSMPPVCSGLGDSHSYDALGRKTSLTHSDGSSVQTSYAGAATKVVDEGNGSSNVQRISQVDGFGRLITVCEVTAQSQMGITPTPAPCGLDISGNGFLTIPTTPLAIF